MVSQFEHQIKKYAIGAAYLIFFFENCHSECGTRKVGLQNLNCNFFCIVTSVLFCFNFEHSLSVIIKFPILNILFRGLTWLIGKVKQLYNVYFLEKKKGRKEGRKRRNGFTYQQIDQNPSKPPFLNKKYPQFKDYQNTKM